ncbi:MAG TPA: uracil-DNA glycosylase [Alphaproteobacteria bacterium]|nr:uracil-DNA glycosylase [Alphaproteobacteria bacterium]
MDKIKELEKIKQDILDDMKCPLKDSAKNLVFGKGNPDASILFIGEAPGAKEDELGIPFVGAAGKELDKLLNSIGLTLDDVYIANILKYRPPENRDPNIEEITRHTPYLIRQIKVIKPAIICTLGNYSTKFVLASFDVSKMNSIAGITKLHGKANDLLIDGMNFKVIPLYHPAAMLYNPNLRSVLAEDFLTMGEILGLKVNKSIPSKPASKQDTMNKYIN